MDFFEETKLEEKPIGYDNIIDNYLDLLNKNQNHHAWLICGAKGIGKNLLAKYLAKKTLELSNNKFQEIESHPDLLTLDPSKGESKKNEIKIDQIRAIKDFLYLTPAIAQHKIIIIDSVDNLNLSAANSLLKILEEPPKNSMFFLVSHRPDSLLKTIKSRCREIYLPKLSDEQANKIIEPLIFDLIEEDFSVKDVYFKLFKHQPGLVKEFAENNGVILYHQIESLISKFEIEVFYEIMNKYDVKNNKVNFDNICFLINYFLRQKINQEFNNENITNIQLIDKLEEFNKNTGTTIALNLDRSSLLLNFFNEIKRFF